MKPVNIMWSHINKREIKYYLNMNSILSKRLKNIFISCQYLLIYANL